MEHDVRFEEILNDEGKGGIQNMCDVLDKVENRARADERKEITGLMSFLASNGRSDDIVKAGQDENFLNKLLADFRGGMMVAK